MCYHIHMQIEVLKINAIERALHLIERKYAPDTLLGEVCGIAVLCLWERTSPRPSAISDLEGFLRQCKVTRRCAGDILGAIGGHWGEYLELLGRYTDDDLTDLFETRYIPRIKTKTASSPCLDALSLLLLDIADGESCLDICSGAGMFVNDVWLAKGAAGGEVVGVDFNREAARLAAVVALVRGTGGKTHVADCFDPRYLRRKFDKVHCSAPFGLSVRELDFGNVCKTLSEAFPDFPTISLTSSEWLFAARAVAALKDGGKAVVVMPRAALDNAQSAQYRRYFLSRGMVESVLAFPGGVYPGTAIAIAVVVFRAGSSETKLFDVSDREYIQAGGTCFNYRRIAADIANLANYGDVVTRGREHLLAHDGDLDPSIYLAGAMSGGDTRAFGELVRDVRRGITVPRSKLARMSSPTGGGLCYISPGNVADGIVDDGAIRLSEVPEGCDGAVAEAGDLVISRSGPSFRVAVLDDPALRYVVDGNLLVCRPLAIDPYCLKGYLDGEDGAKWLVRLSTGLQHSLSTKKLVALPVPVVSKAKERRVARAVRARCGRIRELRRELEGLLASSRTQFSEAMNQGAKSNGD